MKKRMVINMTEKRLERLIRERKKGALIKARTKLFDR